MAFTIVGFVYWKGYPPTVGTWKFTLTIYFAVSKKNISFETQNLRFSHWSAGETWGTDRLDVIRCPTSQNQTDRQSGHLISFPKLMIVGLLNILGIIIIHKLGIPYFTNISWNDTHIRG